MSPCGFIDSSRDDRRNDIMRGAGTGLAPTVIANARKDALEGKSRLGDIAAEETCGARPRETLVKRAFAPSGGMRLRPRQPFIPASSVPHETSRRYNHDSLTAAKNLSIFSAFSRTNLFTESVRSRDSLTLSPFSFLANT